MRESSLVPTNLLNWPRVARRLPEEKLILLSLWAAPFMGCAGFGELPLCPFAASIGISPEALETGIANLVAAGLIITDVDTGEVAILDWFRFHHFKTPTSKQILTREIDKIRSGAIKTVISEKSISCLPTATSTSTKVAAAHKQHPPQISAVPSGKKYSVIGGLDCWDAADRTSAQVITANTAPEDLGIAIDAVRRAGKSPVPGVVQRELLALAHHRKVAAIPPPILASYPPPDLAAQRAGEKLLPASLSKIIPKNQHSETNRG